jgi:hypothetical protein
MAQQTTLLKIFVASPNELINERNTIIEVIRDLNVTLPKINNLILQPIYWERYAFPSSGGDAQAIVNEQLGVDYDIFIGILWTRFGTPTPRYGSGTEEEFNAAYHKYLKNPNQIRIMFYFKDTPPTNLSEINPEELLKVNIFKNELQATKNLFTWDFPSTEGLRWIIHLHLLNQILDFGKTWGFGQKSDQQDIHIEEPAFIEQDVELAEYGFFDLIEIGNERFEEATRILNDIAALMSNNTDKNRKTTAEMNSLPKPVNAHKAKSIINKAASDLDFFASQMEVYVPQLSEKYDQGINALGRSAELSMDFGNSNIEQLNNSLTGMKTIKTAFIDMRESTSTLLEAIKNLPRVTREFNQAKQRAIRILEEYIMKNNTSINLTDEIEISIEKLIETLQVNSKN